MPQPDAVQLLRDAIRCEGPVPAYHREVAARHRREWPSLWRAIDALLAPAGVGPAVPTTTTTTKRSTR